MINYFEVLNISENAEMEVIRSAYRTLAKKYHPDSTRLPDDVAKGKMELINEAYQVLSDDTLRKKYIEELHSKERLQQEENYSQKEAYREDAYSQKSENEHSKNADNINKRTYGSGGDGPDSGENIIYAVVVVIIIVSIISCMIYFMPNILGETFGNINKSIDEILKTF